MRSIFSLHSMFGPTMSGSKVLLNLHVSRHVISIILMQITLASANFSIEIHATQPQEPQIRPRCEVAQAECAFRQGCGMALQAYMIDCGDLISGISERCPAACQRALIALMSTEEGEILVDCDCGESDFCQLHKQRIEVCRPLVLSATAVDSVVSCSTARSICLADPLCSTALDYYHSYCRSMFQGRRCTLRCKNSLDILNRQEKASKLKTCYCEGSEDFACQKIKDRTQRFCSHHHIYHSNLDDSDGDSDDDVSNEIEVIGRSGAAPTYHLVSYTLIALILVAVSRMRCNHQKL